MQKIAALIVRMALSNPSWGYRRIEGSLKHVGHTVAHNTIKKVLKGYYRSELPQRFEVDSALAHLDTQIPQLTIGVNTLGDQAAVGAGRCLRSQPLGEDLAGVIGPADRYDHQPGTCQGHQHCRFHGLPQTSLFGEAGALTSIVKALVSITRE